LPKAEERKGHSEIYKYGQTVHIASDHRTKQRIKKQSVQENKNINTKEEDK